MSMKQIKDYITENRTADSIRKVFSKVQPENEDEFFTIGEEFGTMFGLHIGTALAEFLYGVKRSLSLDSQQNQNIVLELAQKASENLPK